MRRSEVEWMSGEKRICTTSRHGRNGKDKDGWRKQVFVSDSDDREQQIKYLGSSCGRRLGRWGLSLNRGAGNAGDTPQASAQPHQ